MKSLYEEVFKSQQRFLFERIPAFTGSDLRRRVRGIVSFPNEEIFTWVHYFIDDDLRDG